MNNASSPLRPVGLSSARLSKLTVLTLCAFSVQAYAQELEHPVSSLSVNVRVVAFDALVHDRDGELVHHLNKDDFTLFEDGKRRPIRYFSEDSDLPLTIGLMVDTSSSQRSFFAEQQVASKIFLANMLTRPEDNASVLRFDNSITLLQGMTANLHALDSALGKLPEIYPPRPGVDGGTLLFDAICDAAHNAFSKESTRRAVVILTDGEDDGSTGTRDDAIECAQRTNLAVYTALYTTHDHSDEDRFDPRIHVSARERLPGRTNMERISRATGGRVFIVGKKLPIEHIYAAIERDLRSEYRLAYTPPPSRPGRYHKLELKSSVKHSKIQTRIGYYTPE
jgi:VWFA-related protein